uniref:Uncharacterized protein n=1 Tax=Photinus pyralis TaxID=7054 RepID=A0A1Y1KK35_PHOPY
MAIMSTSRSYDMPVSSRLARNWPSMSPTVGKFWTPEKPMSCNCFKKKGHVSQRVCTTNTGDDGGRFDNWEHFIGHVKDDVVCIPVRHEAGQGPPAGHSETAAIVYNDQVATSFFDELC